MAGTHLLGIESAFVCKLPCILRDLRTCIQRAFAAAARARFNGTNVSAQRGSWQFRGLLDTETLPREKGFVHLRDAVGGRPNVGFVSTLRLAWNYARDLC